MSDQGTRPALEKLRRSAIGGLDAARAGRPRVAVQVGHCSQAVGAGDLADTLARLMGDAVHLVRTGCDGACHDAPQIVLAWPSGGHEHLARVSPEDAEEVATRIRAGSASPSTPSNISAKSFEGQRRVALDRCGELDGEGIDEYLETGGYSGLARALSMTPDQVIYEVKESGLRGRGGAYFPAALKWRAVRSTDRSPRYLVVNSEEGEPGIFKDRHLMEGVPHRIIEGMAIAAYASGVEKAFIYINAEAGLSAGRMRKAIDDAEDRNLLGDDILGSEFGLRVEIRRGAGGYVCGEETTLLNTMEGYRREPRLRPPFPTESGLLSSPTVINNPETLASVPFILTHGAKAFAEIGDESGSGTKIVSLSGSVRRPGLAEVPMGTTLRQIVFDIGGGLADGRRLSAIAVGGPSSGVLPESMLDTAIRPGMIHESGVMLGAGGVIALDDRVPVFDAVRSLAAYNADESCGKCTPCREGTPRMVEAIDRLISGAGSPNDLEELQYLAEVVGAASLCGLGQAAGGPITSALHFFGAEISRKAGVS